MAPEAEDLSPEEKLLKVIQGSPKGGPSAEQPGKPGQPSAAGKPAVQGKTAPLPPPAGKPRPGMIGKAAGATGKPAPAAQAPSAGEKAGQAAPQAAPQPGKAAIGGKPPPDRSVKLGAPKPAPDGKSAAADKTATPSKTPTAEKPASGARQPGMMLGKSLEASAPDTTASAAPVATPKKEVPRVGIAVYMASRILFVLLLVLTAGLAWEILADKVESPEPPENVVAVERTPDPQGLGSLDAYVAAVESNRITEELGQVTQSNVVVVTPAGPVNPVADYVAKNLCLDAVGGSSDAQGSRVAVVTDRKTGRTWYIGAGEQMDVDMGDSQGAVVIAVDEVGEDSITFTYQGKPLVLDARR